MHAYSNLGLTRQWQAHNLMKGRESAIYITDRQGSIHVVTHGQVQVSYVDVEFLQ